MIHLVNTGIDNFKYTLSAHSYVYTYEITQIKRQIWGGGLRAILEILYGRSNVQRVREAVSRAGEQVMV